MSAGPDDSSTATLKFGEGFSAPWLVLYGNPGQIRRQLLEAFGIEDDPEISLVELIAKQSVEAQAAYTLATGGAKPVSSSGRRANYRKPDKASTIASGSQVDEAEGETSEASEAERNVSRITTEIQAAGDLGALKKVWATNQEFFSDKRLQKAYKDRSAALKSA